jgi:hypothetical protein
MSAIHPNDFTEALYKRVSSSRYFLQVDSREFSDDKTEVNYVLRNRKTLFNDKNSTIATFRARPLPGCCGVLVVYYLRPTDGKAKTFSSVFSLILKCAGDAKYGAVLMSQRYHSIGHTCLKAVPRQMTFHEFVNPKTKNLITMFQCMTDYVAPKSKPVFQGE